MLEHVTFIGVTSFVKFSIDPGSEYCRSGCSICASVFLVGPPGGEIEAGTGVDCDRDRMGDIVSCFTSGGGGGTSVSDIRDEDDLFGDDACGDGGDAGTSSVSSSASSSSSSGGGPGGGGGGFACCCCAINCFGDRAGPLELRDTFVGRFVSTSSVALESSLERRASSLPAAGIEFKQPIAQI